MSVNLRTKLPGVWLVVGLNLVFIVLVAVSFGLVASKQEKLIETHAQLVLTRERQATKAALADLLLETEEQRASVAAYFVDEEELAIFLERLEGWATESGVVLEVESASIGGENASKVDLSFNVVGAFRDLYQFLVVLDNLPYLISVDGADIRMQAAGNWVANLSLSLLSFETGHAKN